MYDVLVVGSCVQDLTSYAPRFPNPGESVRGSKFVTGFGGKGANQAVMAARLGARTAMVGKVGDDIFGPPALENFRKNNVNCVLDKFESKLYDGHRNLMIKNNSGILPRTALGAGGICMWMYKHILDKVYTTSDASTATATITVSESGENSIVVVLGANELLSIKDIRNSEYLIRESRVLCCQLEINTDVTLEALKLAKSYGVRTILNPAPGLTDLNMELLKYSDIVCPNENEAEFISAMTLRSIEDANRIAASLLNKGPEVVIITLGENGCVYASQHQQTPKHLPSPKVTAKDTTGAGDAFVGSLAYFAATTELPMHEIIRRSCEIAAISVQNYGTQTSYPWREELSKTLFEL